MNFSFVLVQEIPQPGPGVPLVAGAKTADQYTTKTFVEHLREERSNSDDETCIYHASFADQKK